MELKYKKTELETSKILTVSQLVAKAVKQLLSLLHTSKDICTHLVATMMGVSPLLLSSLISDFAGVPNNSCNVFSCIPCDTCFIQAT